MQLSSQLGSVPKKPVASLLHQIRYFHLSSSWLELNKAKLNEAELPSVHKGETANNHQTPLRVSVQEVQTVDDEAIKEHYQETKGLENTDAEEWREQAVTLSQLPSIYLKLSKSRLTGTCM